MRGWPPRSMQIVSVLPSVRWESRLLTKWARHKSSKTSQTSLCLRFIVCIVLAGTPCPRWPECRHVIMVIERAGSENGYLGRRRLLWYYHFQSPFNAEIVTCLKLQSEIRKKTMAVFFFRGHSNPTCPPTSIKGWLKKKSRVWLENHTPFS